MKTYATAFELIKDHVSDPRNDGSYILELNERETKELMDLAQIEADIVKGHIDELLP